MKMLFAIALGGAVGSLLRYGASVGIHAFLPRSFPYGTGSVNVLGCFLMGICAVLLVERWQVSPELRNGILVGVLGGFTTFSAFSIEIYQMLAGGEGLRAVLYMTASVVLCVGATALGVWLMRGA